MAGSFSESLENSRVKNWRGQEFIPAQTLDDLLDAPTVSKILAELVSAGCMQPYQKHEALETILRDGKRVFATLCTMGKESFIMEFIRHFDGFNKSRLDSVLPLEEAELKDIFPDDHSQDYRIFYDHQWDFLAPVFARNLWYRKLHDRTILPFMREEALGKGGSGTVSRVSLHGSNQEFDISTREEVVVAIKTFQEKTPRSKSRHEQHILSLLRHLRHPHIIEFYTAYTLGKKEVHHLILQAADHDLRWLLNQKRPATFNDEVIFRGLWGISSAIHHVHNYVWEESSLSLVGCHFDLKPANILIRGTDFLLSDFGLSRLKHQGERSSSEHGGGLQDYAAPECHLIDDDQLETMRSRRSSDIWSLGCIFTEVAAYMLHDKQGVEDFQKAREVKLMGGRIICSVFFDAGNKSHPKVAEWLNDMERFSRFAASAGLVCLARNMLNMDPSQRPTSWEVSRRSFLIWAQHVCDGVSDLFFRIQKRSGTNAVIEFERFDAWACVSGIREASSGAEIDWTSLSAAQVQFECIENFLMGLRKDLRLHDSLDDKGEPDDSMTAGLEASLRLNVDKLWNTQPPENVQKMLQRATTKLFSRNTVDYLPRINTGSDTEIFNHMRLLTAMKQVTKALDKDRVGPLRMQIDRSRVRITNQCKMPVSKRLGCFEHPDGTKVSVLIESLEYAEAYIDHPEPLIQRVDGLTLALSTLSDLSKTFPVLPCQGFCHLEQQAFGLVFRIPSHGPSSIHNVSSHILEPMTLIDVIRETQSRERRPPLDDLLNLAWTLADSVATFHAAEWLHKNLCSFNILFFPTNRKYIADSMSSPYVSGFNFSRENSQSAFSIGPSTEKDASDYQHPEYNGSDNPGAAVRFRQEFDYYSLGLILLEIGLWKPLKSLLKGKEELSPAEIRSFLLEKRAKELSSYVGRRYQEAVMACLNGAVSEGLDCFRDRVLSLLKHIRSSPV